MRKRLKGSLRITYAAMTVALTVVMLYLASILPVGRIAMYFIASIIITMLVEERELALSIVAFLASGAISFLFAADKLSVFPYAALLGHYGIFRQFVTPHVRDRWLQWFVKLLYANAFILLCIWIVTGWLQLLDLQPLLAILPFWAWVVIAQPVLVGYDMLFAFMVRFYDTVLRPLLVGRRN